MYDQSGHDKTSMQVLHSVLSEMDLSSFKRHRVSIFEDLSHARIEFSLKDNGSHIKRGFFRIRRAFNDNHQTSFTLDIKIIADTKTPGKFSIFSEITPDGRALKDVVRLHPTT